MFIDGLVYTNLAKNMAAGHGSLWQPILDVGGPVFYGHPPLLPFLQSGFFSVFGDGLHTEDLYNFSVLALTVLLLFKLWQCLVPQQQDAKLFFFPLLLFALSQEVQLRYANTMLECGMTVFLLATTYAFLKLKGQSFYFALIATGIGTLLATLCKGPVGLFPLAMPFLYYLLVEKRFSFLALCLPGIALLIGYALLFLTTPAAYAFLSEYLDQQVLTALQGKGIENIAGSRFSILRSLVLTNIPALALCSLLYFFGKASAPLPTSKQKRSALWLLAVGATAILPIMVSIKQASYYQLPALPFLFIGLGLLLLPKLRSLFQFFAQRRVPRLVMMSIGVLGLVAGLFVAISMLGTTDRRDRTPLKEAELIASAMAEQQASVYQLKILGKKRAFDSATSYSVTGFLNRFHNIYETENETAITLYLDTGGGVFPDTLGVEVLVREGDLLLVRE
jgi:hypothetical protein